MKRLLIAILMVSLLLLAGCATPVKKITENPDDYMGKKVLIKGEVIAPIDFGKMQGFTLKDEETSIMVSSEKVPDHGDIVNVRGTVVKGVLMGPYIFADKVAVKSD